MQRDFEAFKEDIANGMNSPFKKICRKFKKKKGKKKGSQHYRCIAFTEIFLT